MRLSLLALVVLSTAAPSAQVASASAGSSVAESFRLPDDLAAEIAADAHGARGDVWAGVLVGVVAAPAGLTGGISGMFALIVLKGCFPFGCTGSTVGPTGYASAWILGSAAGTMFITRELTASSSRRGPNFRPDDWKAAFVGIGVGTLIGIGTTMALNGISEDATFGGMVATTALQAVGAGMAVGLRP